MECFNCHQTGHLARDCSWASELSTARPDPLAAWRRDPAEISADPHGWADKIRERMNWPPPAGQDKGGQDTDRVLAAQQVAESRATRTVLP